jgi:hypothetical protein
MPLFISSLSTSSQSDAGPKVQIIFVLFINQYLLAYLLMS